MKPSLVFAMLFGASAFAAEEIDVTRLYTVSTDGSTTSLKPGEKGKFVLSITTLEGAYVSDEAPLKVELEGTNATVASSKLTLKDSVATNDRKDKKTADPRFEVPFDASADKGSVDAKATFFICTKNICARQQKALSVPFETIAAVTPSDAKPATQTTSKAKRK